MSANIASVRNWGIEAPDIPNTANQQSRFRWEKTYTPSEPGQTATIYRLLSLTLARATPMADDVTREELNAKLETVEARTETRFMELSGKMDRVADSISSLRSEVSAVRADNKFTRSTIIVAVVGSVIAGLAALWVTQSNMLASFSAGIALHEAPPQRPSSNHQ